MRPERLLALWIVAASPAFGRDGPTLRLSLDWPRGKVYVGQPIVSTVQVVAGAERPRVTARSSPDFEVVPLDGVEVRPLASTSIGRARDVTNAFRFRVRFVPLRPGAWHTPPLTITAGPLSGIVPPRNVNVLAPPAAGRTAAFLGGVGRLEAKAEVRPASVALGESFEYRLTLSGPGAVGSNEPPSLLPSGSGRRIERLPAESTVEPPSRTFRVRVRPLKAGEFAIPARLISSLEPDSGTYRTTAANAVRVRVVDVPGFDPGTLEVPPTPSPPRSFRIAAAVAAGLAIPAAVAIAILRIGTLRRGRFDPLRFAREAGSRLGHEPDGRRFGQAANRELAELLRRLGGRPTGEVTPEEARDWIERLTRDADLAARAADAMQALDRCLYRGAQAVTLAAEARSDFLTVFVEVCERAGAKKPREAPGAA